MTAPWNGVNSNNVPFVKDRSYQDILPTLNFVLDVSDTQKDPRLGRTRRLAGRSHGLSALEIPTTSPAARRSRLR